jgi:hypothetical protein
MTTPQDVQQFIGRTAVDSEGNKVGKIGRLRGSGKAAWRLPPVSGTGCWRGCDVSLCVVSNPAENKPGTAVPALA